MLKYNAASQIGKIHEAVNHFIVSELEWHGVQGIVPSHGDILMCLYREDGLTINELVDKIHRTQPTVTVLVNKLEKLGYVERVKRAQDGRVALIKLTERGMELKPIFDLISTQLKERIYGDLSNDQREQLELLLEHVYRRI